jgi:hypothetical protein
VSGEVRTDLYSDAQRTSDVQYKMHALCMVAAVTVLEVKLETSVFYRVEPAATGPIHIYTDIT